MESFQPLVSIIVPVFNMEKYVGDAIKSILDQDYPNKEVIVLDDGSTDNTPSVIKKFANHITCIKHKNMGAPATMNKGWKIAKGDIIGYLSADDLLYKSAISESVKFFKNKNTVLTFCDFQLIDPFSKKIKSVVRNSFSYQHLVSDHFNPIGPGAFFRRRCFEEIGGWNENLSQIPDHEYWLRLGLKGSFHHISKELAAFRVHEQSNTFSKSSFAQALEPIKVMNNFFQRNDLSKNILNLESQAISSAHLVSAQLHARSNRYTEACKHLAISIKKNPKQVFSKKIIKIIINALFNRLGYKVLWKIRKKHFCA